MKSCLCKQIVYGLLSKSKTNGVQQMQFQLRIQSYTSAWAWPRSPSSPEQFRRSHWNQQGLRYSPSVPHQSPMKSVKAWRSALCCHFHEHRDAAAKGKLWYYNSILRFLTRDCPDKPWTALFLGVPTPTPWRAVFSSIWWTIGAGSQENYKDNGDLGSNSYKWLYIPPRSTPRHSGKDLGHVQAGTWSNEHRYQMISRPQVYLNSARDPCVRFNQPCLIFTSLPFLVYFQTSLPSTLGFFVNLRSRYFQGLDGSCTAAVKHLLAVYSFGQIGVMGIQLITPDVLSRSPGRPYGIL